MPMTTVRINGGVVQEFEVSTRRCITGWTWTPRKAPQERKTSIIAGYSQNTEDPGTIYTCTCTYMYIQLSGKIEFFTCF